MAGQPRADKVALITGAGSGMGRGRGRTVRGRGRPGRRQRRRRSGAGTKPSTRCAPPAATRRSCAPTSPSASDCEAMVRAATDTYGALHVLYNNAGIFPPTTVACSTRPRRRGNA